MPLGCSTQSGGDYTAHYKTSGSVACASEQYQLACKDAGHVLTVSDGCVEGLKNIGVEGDVVMDDLSDGDVKQAMKDAGYIRSTLFPAAHEACKHEIADAITLLRQVGAAEGSSPTGDVTVKSVIQQAVKGAYMDLIPGRFGTGADDFPGDIYKRPLFLDVNALWPAVHAKAWGTVGTLAGRISKRLLLIWDP